MKSGSELAISAMKKEFARLSKAADRAKHESDEYLGIGSEMIAIHNEFAEIVKSKDHSEATIKKLGVLSARSKRTETLHLHRDIHSRDGCYCIAVL